VTPSRDTHAANPMILIKVNNPFLWLGFVLCIIFGLINVSLFGGALHHWLGYTCLVMAGVGAIAIIIDEATS
jgi:hypothetical protein